MGMRNADSGPAVRLRRILARRPASASEAEVERAELKFYLEYLREGMTVFDVGANVGEVALVFSKFVGSNGRVHAFEASRAAHERLQTVCRATGRGNVVLNHLAVTDKEGMVSLHVYDERHLGWSSLADRPLDRYGIHVRPVAVEEVPAVSLDAYCEREGVEQIDLLKIDVEGAEYQVLLGARRLLASRAIRCVTFEFGQTTFDMGNNPDEIESYLKEKGYTVRNIVGGDPVFPGRAGAESARYSMHWARPY